MSNRFQKTKVLFSQSSICQVWTETAPGPHKWLLLVSLTGYTDWLTYNISCLDVKYVCYEYKGKVQNKKKVKKTNKCSFCLYTYIHSRKTNTFIFFPKRTWKILKNVQNAKEKKHFISLHCPMLSVVVFPPLFLNLSLYVILDIPEDSQKKGFQKCGEGREIY